jgi:hypothetical protein
MFRVSSEQFLRPGPFLCGFPKKRGEFYTLKTSSAMLSSKPVLFGAVALALASPVFSFHGAALPSTMRLRTSASSIATPVRPLRAMGGIAGARMLSDDVAHAAPRMLPAVRSAGATSMKASSSSSDGIMSKILKIDFQLIIFFALWFLGNYYYNITNKLALKAAGGLEIQSTSIPFCQLLRKLFIRPCKNAFVLIRVSWQVLLVSRSPSLPSSSELVAFMPSSCGLLRMLVDSRRSGLFGLS